MDMISVSLDETNPAMATPSTAQAVLDMLDRADRAIDIDPRQAKVLIGQASRLLEPGSRPAAPFRTPRAPPSLTPWQERKVLSHISAHLDEAISNGQLAEVVGLSIGHFSRCFKGSFGVSPHEYLIRSRLERVKVLIRQTQAPLSQIALDSGFADQAHMSRQFHAVVGCTPTRWRRTRPPESLT